MGIKYDARQFFRWGKFINKVSKKQIDKLINDGSDIIDIGESTRPDLQRFLTMKSGGELKKL